MLALLCYRSLFEGVARRLQQDIALLEHGVAAGRQVRARDSDVRVPARALGHDGQILPAAIVEPAVLDALRP